MEDDSIKIVKQYYDDIANKEWERLDTHPFEFILTTWMMDKYIRPGDTILDIGGGPGRYSINYAQKGCSVTLIDLSDNNICLAEQKSKEFGVSIKSFAKNCLDLEELHLEQFDHVFLMGPLYHLRKETDRINAVELALKHLKKNGMLYVSFIMAFAGIIYDLQHAGYIVGDSNNPATAPLLESVAQGIDYLGPGFTSVYFYHQNNILSFMKQFTLEKLHLFGQESFLAPNKLDIVAREQLEINCWIELAKRYIELPELLSWSEHAMYIGRKL